MTITTLQGPAKVDFGGVTYRIPDGQLAELRIAPAAIESIGNQTFNQKPLDEEGEKLLQDLAESHPNRVMRSRGASFSDQLAAAIFLLTVPRSASGSSGATQNVMYPLTSFLSGDAHDEAVALLTDILHLLLDELPPQGLHHIQTRSRERLLCLVEHRPRSGSHRSPSGSSGPAI